MDVRRTTNAYEHAGKWKLVLHKTENPSQNINA
jgi:hypothetical protein